jgi:prepilin peptidase CpaA
MAAALCARLWGAEVVSFSARHVVLWIILLLVIVAAVRDCRTHEVPDWISLVILACAVLATVCHWTQTGWRDLAAGLCLGLAVSASLFYLGALGGADVKLIAALGAVVGPLSLLCVLFWTAVAGGLLALVAKSRGKRDFAYVPAIAAGLLIQTLWPEGLHIVLLR